MANRLIQFNTVRHDKVLHAARPGGDPPRILQCRDEISEAQSVIADIQRQIRTPGFDPGDVAILFRTNEQPRAFEAELRQAKIPYVLVGGTSFFDRKEVRDMLAYARTLVMPRDETALLRIINVPPRGIGSRTVQTLMEHAVEQGQTLWEVMTARPEAARLPAKAADVIDHFVRQIRKYQQLVSAAARHGLTSVINQLISEIGYEQELARIYDDPKERQSRWDAVQEVVNALGAYEANTSNPSLAGFLDEVALAGRDMDDDKESQLRPTALTLMTLHCAKGLEFPVVYLVGMEEGILPHRRSVDADARAIEEERRLCYVGVTRAQDRLTFSFARTRRKWGKPRETMASRFLYELTGQAERSPHRRAQKKTRGSGRRPAKPRRK
jgi:DNA helicase-2/ATP-dependent DNA helicase PcrA